MHATLEIRTDFLTSMSKSGIDHYRELCQKVFSDPTKTVLSDAEIVERLQAEERAGRTSIPLGCPSPRPDGSCPGHDRGEG